MRRIASLLFLCFFAAPAAAGYSLAPAVKFAEINWPDFTSAIAVGDLNGDHRSDAVLVESPPPGSGSGATPMLVIRYQTPTGGLSAPTTLSLPAGAGRGLTVADLNRDGIADILVGTADGVLAFISRASLPGQFDSTLYQDFQQATSLVVVDVNGDGFLDVVCADGQYEFTAPLVIQYGDGAGGLLGQQVLNINTAVYAISSGDINHDGFPDLLLHRIPRSTVGVLYHDGKLGYSKTPVVYDFGQFLTNPVLGDFNGDGRLDIVGNPWSDYYQGVPAPPLPLAVAPQNAPRGHEPFTAVHAVETAALSTYMLSRDVDGDGKDDLLVAHHDPISALGVYQQDRLGLGSEALYKLPVGGYEQKSALMAMAVGDLNGDGCSDVAYADFNLGLVLLKGQGCTAPADLAVAISGNSSLVSLGVANGAAAETAESPLLRIQLSTALSNLSVTSLPAGCVTRSRATRVIRLECRLSTLSPGSTAAVALPISFMGPQGDTLTVSAQISTESFETSQSNNFAWQQFLL